MDGPVSYTHLEQFCSANEKNIFVGCADNRIADVYGNQIAIYFKAAFISIGFWERAYAGEIFYHIPGQNMPCYYCALGDGGGISERAIANHHVYSCLLYTSIIGIMQFYLLRLPCSVLHLLRLWHATESFMRSRQYLCAQ